MKKKRAILFCASFLFMVLPFSFAQEKPDHIELKFILLPEDLAHEDYVKILDVTKKPPNQICVEKAPSFTENDFMQVSFERYHGSYPTVAFTINKEKLLRLKEKINKNSIGIFVNDELVLIAKAKIFIHWSESEIIYKDMKTAKGVGSLIFVCGWYELKLEGAARRLGISVISSVE